MNKSPNSITNQIQQKNNFKTVLKLGCILQLLLGFCLLICMLANYYQFSIIFSCLIAVILIIEIVLKGISQSQYWWNLQNKWEIGLLLVFISFIIIENLRIDLSVVVDELTGVLILIRYGSKLYQTKYLQAEKKEFSNEFEFSIKSNNQNEAQIQM